MNLLADIPYAIREGRATGSIGNLIKHPLLREHEDGNQKR